MGHMLPVNNRRIVRLMLFAAATFIPVTTIAAQERVARNLPTRNVLTRADLDRLRDDETALNAIAQLRPWFLRPRAVSFSSAGRAIIAVYINSHPIGGPEILHGIRVADIEKIELVPRTDAHLLLGAGRGADALINITLRRHVVR